MTQEIQEYVLAVTKALNALPPAPDSFALDVKLVETVSGAEEPQGLWLDEFGEENWYFDGDVQRMQTVKVKLKERLSGE